MTTLDPDRSYATPIVGSGFFGPAAKFQLDNAFNDPRSYEVIFEREPHNAFDHNAIAVLISSNGYATRVGYVPKARQKPFLETFGLFGPNVRLKCSATCLYRADKKPHVAPAILDVVQPPSEIADGS